MTDREPEKQELPELTAKQAKFAEALLEGKTAYDAYKLAYDAENMADTTIYVEACLLKQNPKITIIMDAAKRAGAKQAEYTAQAHINELDEAMVLAKEGNNLGAMVRATELKGKVCGHYVERVRNETPEPVNDALDAIEKLLGPEYRALAADKLGMKNVVSMKNKA